MAKTRYRPKNQTLIEFRLARTMAKSKSRLKIQIMTEFCLTRNLVRIKYRQSSRALKKVMKTEFRQTRTKPKTDSRRTKKQMTDKERSKDYTQKYAHLTIPKR